MADLTNRSVASSYKELLKTASGDGLTPTLTVVEDGDATQSSLQLATNAARLTGTLQVDGVTTLANPTESTTKDNGSLVVEGGVGIEKNLNVGGNLEVTGNAVIQGTLTANGGTLTLGDANTDNVVFQADVNSDIRPNVNDAYSLGSPTLQWRDLHVDGTAFIDNMQIHDSALITPDGPVTISPSTGAGTLVINPVGVSSMNNVTIGAATPRDGTFSNLTALTSQVISATTPSTNKDTGALVVEGGVGIEQSLNVGGDFGLTGNAAVNGGNLTTSSATFNLVNANATTLNVGGAATTLNIGAATGTTTVNHSLTVAGGAGQSFTINDGSVSRFTVDSTNGNTAISGTLSVTGTSSLTGNTTVSGTLGVTGAATLTDDLAVNGGDLTTSAATFNLLNTNATSVNFAGAGILVEIGAATGTTNINNNLDVDGDLNIDGGDLTVSTATFNLANTTATTLNIGGAATTLEIGAATGTTNVNNNLDVDGDVNIDGGDLTVSTATFNLANTTATTLNLGGAATTVELGAASGTTNINNNLVVDLDLQVKGGDLTTDQTTFNLLNSTATTVNFAGAATTLELGAATGTTSINHDLTVDGNTTLGNANTDTVTFTARAASNLVPSTDDTRDLGSATLEWKDLYIDGTANIDSLVADTADINGGTVDGVTIGTNAVATDLRVDNLRLDANTVSSTDTNGNIVLDPNGTGIVSVAKALTVTGNLTANANTTLGDANTDTVTFNARAASSLVPATDDTHDLGASALEWKDLFIDGTAKVDTLTVDEHATVAGNLTVTGNLTVNGTTTNINTTNLVVEDKNVILGDVTAPTDITADGGGITLKGATDKTINWVDATDAWTSSEHLNLANTKEYRVNGNSVLSATTLGSGVTASSLTSTGTVTSGTWSSTILTDDSAFTLRDNADSTKRVQFEVSGVTAGQTRTLTVADANQTLVGFTGTSADSWNWDTDFDHITVVIPGVGTRKIPYYV